MRKTTEEVLRNRVKFIGDGCWELLGTPAEVIAELNSAFIEIVQDIRSIEYPPSGKEYHFQDGSWTNDFNGYLRRPAKEK